MINNPNCVDAISIYLDGDLVKDQERPRSKQTKLEIKYAHTKCTSHFLILTVEVHIKGKEACYKASSRLTYHSPLNDTQQQECLRKVEAEKEDKEKQRIEVQKPSKTRQVKHIRKNGTTEPPPRTLQSLPNISIPKKPPNSMKRAQNINLDSNNDTVAEDVVTGKMIAEVVNEKPEMDNSLIFIGSMSFAGGLVVMMALLLIVYLVRRRRRRGKFKVKQAVDLNFTYGTYSDYFSDYNTVEDTNDYYSSHI